MPIAWIVLIVVFTAVLGLAGVRRRLANREDDSLHIRDSELVIVAHQSELAQKLRRIDQWGKGLTIAGIVYGLVLLGYVLYDVWQAGQRLSVN